MGTGPDLMLVHLGAAARAARKAHGRKQIHIAVRLDVSEQTVQNFELGHHWPRNPDVTIRGYADELGIDPLEIWREALRRWEDARS